jgi:hypothetical protein
MTECARQRRLVNTRLRRHFKFEPPIGRVFKIRGLLNLPNDNATGETMTTQAIQKTRQPIFDRAQRTQDYLLVSSFGLWALLLGASPVLAFRMLLAS